MRQELVKVIWQAFHEHAHMPGRPANIETGDDPQDANGMREVAFQSSLLWDCGGAKNPVIQIC